MSADFIDWEYALPPGSETAIHKVRRDLVAHLAEPNGRPVSIEVLVHPPMTIEKVWQTIGALTLEKEGFIARDSETSDFRLTEDGQRFATGIDILKVNT